MTHDQRPLAILIPPKQAAAALAVSERTLWSLTKAGEIPSVKIGRSVRYDQADLRRWIQSRKTGKMAEEASCKYHLEALVRCASNE